MYRQLLYIISTSLISALLLNCTTRTTENKSLDEITKTGQRNAEAEQLFNKALACAKQGRHLDAIDYYEQSIEISASCEAYINLGLEQSVVGELDESLICYNKAIELNPTSYNAFYNRGNSKGRLADYQGAIDDYSKAIQLNPFLAIAFQNRGVTKVLYLKDKIGGCEDLHKALELGATALIKH